MKAVTDVFVIELQTVSTVVETVKLGLIFFSSDYFLWLNIEFSSEVYW